MDGRVVVFPSTSPNDLRVTACDPLRGVPVAELEVRKSYATGKHYSPQATALGSPRGMDARLQGLATVVRLSKLGRRL